MAAECLRGFFFFTERELDMQVYNTVNGIQQQMPTQGTEGKATPTIRVISLIRHSTVLSCEVMQLLQVRA